jgi:tetratricopeptide (TPR) repeat protein
MTRAADKNELEQQIEELWGLLERRQNLEALAVLDQLNEARADVGLCTEVAEMLFHHGLLDQAERWGDVAYANAQRGASSNLTLLHLMGLRADIAWQRADFALAEQRWSECAQHFPHSAGRSLAAAAQAVLRLGERESAREFAREALRHGTEILQVHFTAGAVLYFLDRAEGRPHLEALAQSYSDPGPERSAYQRLARHFMRQQPESLPRWSGHDRMAYELARRFGVPVVSAIEREQAWLAQDELGPESDIRSDDRWALGQSSMLSYSAPFGAVPGTLPWPGRNAA